MFMKVTMFGTGMVLVLLASASLAQGPDVEVLPLNVPADLDLSGNVLYAVNFGNNGNPTLSGFVFSQDQGCPQLSFTSDAEGETSRWQGIPPNTGYPDLDMLLHGVIWVYSDVDATTSISAGGLSAGITPVRLHLLLGR